VILTQVVKQPRRARQFASAERAGELGRHLCDRAQMLAKSVTLSPFIPRMSPGSQLHLGITPLVRVSSCRSETREWILVRTFVLAQAPHSANSAYTSQNLTNYRAFGLGLPRTSVLILM
jgi:hypothetical protein